MRKLSDRKKKPRVYSIIMMLYFNFSAQVICGNELSEAVKVTTGVKQGYILSPFTLF